MQSSRSITMLWRIIKATLLENECFPYKILLFRSCGLRCAIYDIEIPRILWKDQSLTTSDGGPPFDIGNLGHHAQKAFWSWPVYDLLYSGQLEGYIPTKKVRGYTFTVFIVQPFPFFRPFMGGTTWDNPFGKAARKTRNGFLKRRPMEPIVKRWVVKNERVLRL